MRARSLILGAVASLVLAVNAFAAPSYDPFSYAGAIISAYGAFPFGDEVVGSAFQVSSNLTVNKLGIFDQGGNGFEADHPVGIWDSAGNLLASTTVTSVSTKDQFNYRWEAISPLQLNSGTTYVVGALYNGQGINDAYWYNAAINPLFTYIENRLGSDPSGGSLNNLVFPVDTYGHKGFFGANVAVTPIPSIAWLLGSGIIGLIGLKRKGFTKR